MSLSNNLYEILNVLPDAKEEEIKKSYKALAKELHPDRNSNENATEQFQNLNKAYNIIMDSEKRRIYDLQCNNPINSDSLSLNDIFNYFFNNYRVSPEYSFSYDDNNTTHKNNDIKFDSSLFTKESLLDAHNDINRAKYMAENIYSMAKKAWPMLSKIFKPEVFFNTLNKSFYQQKPTNNTFNEDKHYSYTTSTAFHTNTSEIFESYTFLKSSTTLSTSPEDITLNIKEENNNNTPNNHTHKESVNNKNDLYSNSNNNNNNNDKHNNKNEHNNNNNGDNINSNNNNTNTNNNDNTNTHIHTHTNNNNNNNNPDTNNNHPRKENNNSEPNKNKEMHYVSKDKNLLSSFSSSNKKNKKKTSWKIRNKESKVTVEKKYKEIKDESILDDSLLLVNENDVSNNNNNNNSGTNNYKNDQHSSSSSSDFKNHHSVDKKIFKLINNPSSLSTSYKLPSLLDSLNHNLIIKDASIDKNYQEGNFNIEWNKLSQDYYTTNIYINNEKKININSKSDIGREIRDKWINLNFILPCVYCHTKGFIFDHLDKCKKCNIDIINNGTDNINLNCDNEYKNKENFNINNKDRHTLKAFMTKKSKFNTLSSGGDDKKEYIQKDEHITIPLLLKRNIYLYNQQCINIISTIKNNIPSSHLSYSKEIINNDCDDSILNLKENNQDITTSPIISTPRRLHKNKISIVPRNKTSFSLINIKNCAKCFDPLIAKYLCPFCNGLGKFEMTFFQQIIVESNNFDNKDDKNSETDIITDEYECVMIINTNIKNQKRKRTFVINIMVTH